MKYRNIMGVIISRRLGRSLGVNLIPGKICSLDCVYCEAGRTQTLTAERQTFFAVDDIIYQLRCYLTENPDIDFITYSGAGEPTLYSLLGEVSRRIKEEFSRYKLALITNGSLFYREDVRRDAMYADVVMPSLDAVSKEVFDKVNKPDSSLDNENIIDGLCKFRSVYTGQIWLEYFVVPGVNDGDEELKLMRETVVKINPDILQLNSLDRPSPAGDVPIASREHLERLKEYFSYAGISTQIISRVPENDESTQQQILKILQESPVAIEEIRKGFALCDNAISNLTLSGKIEMTENGGVSFYRLKKGAVLGS